MLEIGQLGCVAWRAWLEGSMGWGLSKVVVVTLEG